MKGDWWNSNWSCTDLLHVISFPFPFCKRPTIGALQCHLPLVDKCSPDTEYYYYQDKHSLANIS